MRTTPASTSSAVRARRGPVPFAGERSAMNSVPEHTGRRRHSTVRFAETAIRLSFAEGQQAERDGRDGSPLSPLLYESSFRALALLPTQDPASSTNPSYVWRVSGIADLPSNIKALIKAAFDPGHEVRNGLDAMDSQIAEITTIAGFDLHTGEAWRCFKGILLGDVLGMLTLIGSAQTCPPGKNNPCPALGHSSGPSRPNKTGNLSITRRMARRWRPRGAGWLTRDSSGRWRAWRVYGTIVPGPGDGESRRPRCRPAPFPLPSRNSRRSRCSRFDLGLHDSPSQVAGQLSGLADGISRTCHRRWEVLSTRAISASLSTTDLISASVMRRPVTGLAGLRLPSS